MDKSARSFAGRNTKGLRSNRDLSAFPRRLRVFWNELGDQNPSGWRYPSIRPIVWFRLHARENIGKGYRQFAQRNVRALLSVVRIASNCLTKFRARRSTPEIHRSIPGEFAAHLRSDRNIPSPSARIRE